MSGGFSASLRLLEEGDRDIPRLVRERDPEPVDAAEADKVRRHIEGRARVCKFLHAGKPLALRQMLKGGLLGGQAVQIRSRAGEALLTGAYPTSFAQWSIN